MLAPKKGKSPALAYVTIAGGSSVGIFGISNAFQVLAHMTPLVAAEYCGGVLVFGLVLSSINAFSGPAYLFQSNFWKKTFGNIDKDQVRRQLIYDLRLLRNDLSQIRGYDEYRGQLIAVVDQEINRLKVRRIKSPFTASRKTLELIEKRRLDIVAPLPDALQKPPKMEIISSTVNAPDAPAALSPGPAASEVIPIESSDQAQ